MSDPSNDNSSGGSISTIQHYWHILLKWKWLAATFFSVVVAGATLFSMLVPHVYISRGTIWAEEQLNILPFEDIQRLDSSSVSPQSYAQLLRSRVLASAVIDGQKLYERPVFAGNPAKGKSLPSPDGRGLPRAAHREVPGQDIHKAHREDQAHRSHLQRRRSEVCLRDPRRPVQRIHRYDHKPEI